MTARAGPSARERQSHIFARHPRDWYVEEPWQSKRFFDVAAMTGAPVSGLLLDPACGLGRIVRNALSAGIAARGSDVAARWRRDPAYCAREERVFALGDFLKPNWPPRGGTWARPATIMSNSPFRKVRPFLSAALARAERVIFLLPWTWFCGAGTSAFLETTPLFAVYPLGPRASMPPGPYILAGKRPEGGRQDHAWYEWRRGATPVAEGGARPVVIAIRREAEEPACPALAEARDAA